MFILCPAQMFSSEICQIIKNTFENTNNFVEHLKTASSVKYLYCWLCDYIISQLFESFFPTIDSIFFCGSEVHSLLIPFSKESIKVKKVLNFSLFDTCAMLTHMSRNKKWIDIIIIHAQSPASRAQRPASDSCVQSPGIPVCLIKLLTSLDK